MTDKTYDVAVAGAGPAGAQCARDVSARGYDVVVLETEEEDAFPSTSNKSTGGTFPDTLASFGIPDDVVQNFTDSVVIESPNSHYVQEHPGGVLDFGAFKQWLVDDGRRKGAEYRFGARVSEPVVGDGRAVGVRYNGDEEVRAKIVVDATGPSAALAEPMGVVDLRRDRQAIGVEYEMENVSMNPDGYADLRGAMMLRLDHDIAPGGYSWVFHTGGDTAKVGVCYIQNEVHERRADGETVDGYLERWIENDPRFEDAVRIDGAHHRGSAHVQKPESMSAPGLMAVGDTVPSVDPVWGEGIGKCMRSGRAAGVTADTCLQADEFSAEAVSLYDDIWHDRVAPNVDARLLLANLLYEVPNERYDRFMRDLRATDDEVLSKANEGSKRAMMKLIHLGDVPALARVGRRLLSPS
ncbi:NAD(P)/FAD-dependent oxidoreductase [Haladaptatus sp. F3-133]|uniref:NAD(P)/FAD-dependent oxidoreductase n=1 Tax=Halorutilus salinus TaxID=2487751 RepID=A0A9Q4GJ77_9EURY|nr:NAD(P)/FAD-dependent oxidoreductase [Halorutilus salinus]MCX2819638.1 NAD(P)/FAD-dependent oxidoreductase [Halorutilus salinus]